MKRQFIAGADDGGRRLESVVRRLIPGLPLSALHKALRTGDIRLNGVRSGPDARVSEGDTLSVWEALLDPPRPASSAAPIPPDWVVFLGDDLAVVNKPAGLATHGGGQSDEPPLDERVRAWLPASGLAFRPGPLHRLDQGTSGLVVFSRTLAGAHAFSEALRRREVSKTYLAVLTGSLNETKEADQSLSRDEGARTTRPAPGGDDAHTVFVPLARADGLTLARVDLGTGRTHQIRAHALAIGHPLAGDGKYSGGPTPPGLDVPFFLHAWKLESALLPPLAAPLPEARKLWLKNKFKFQS